MPIDNGKHPAGLQNIVDGARKPGLVWYPVECVREKHVVNAVAHDLRNVVSIGRNEYAVGEAAIGQPHACCLKQLASMSIAITSRAIFDNCHVNQPSPEHRSTTVMPGTTPASLTT
jgi:hypothetical protein